MNLHQATDRVFRDRLDLESVAEAMIPIIGSLYRRNHVVTTVHGRRLPNQSANQILKLHRFARHIDGGELSPEQTLAMLHRLSALNPSTATIDVAALNNRFRAEAPIELDEFLRRELGPILDRPAPTSEPTDVVLFGFGRIGRIVARILLARNGGTGVRLRAVVTRDDSVDALIKRASLLRRDSVHGPFDGTITVDPDRRTITANGTVLQFIAARDPATADYARFGIRDAILIDNTGKWRDRVGLEQHLIHPEIKRVLLTAPGKADLPNIVHGVNDEDIAEEAVVAAASCTTNAVTPVLAAIDRRFGIEHGHIETVHSFTNDQNLTDNYHSADRRGRSATLNMVIAETGAATAAAKAYPALAGKLTGNAIRVPTPNVSLAVLHVQLSESVTRNDLNGFLRGVSLDSDLRRQIDYVESPEVVSSDFIGARKAGIVDGLATIADGTNAVVYVWYDNEYGYSRQVVRCLETMTGTRLPAYPTTSRHAPTLVGSS